MSKISQFISFILDSGATPEMTPLQRQKIKHTHTFALYNNLPALSLLIFLYYEGAPYNALVYLFINCLVNTLLFLVSRYVSPVATKFIFIINWNLTILFLGGHLSNNNEHVQEFMHLWIFASACIPLMVFEIKEWFKLIIGIGIVLCSHFLVIPFDLAFETPHDVDFYNGPIFESVNFMLAMAFMAGSIFVYQLRDLRVYTYLINRLQITNTELVEHEKMLLEANKELDNFVYRASHDIKGPLARLKGVCHVALMQTKDDDSRKFFMLLDNEALRLNTILNKLLQVKDLKMTTPEKESVNLKQAMLETLEGMKQFEGYKEVTFQLDIPEFLEVHTDRKLLTLLLTNIMDNAVLYRSLTSDKPTVMVHAGSTLTDVVIYIEDNGIGIPDDYLDKIFEMHFRATERSNGAGLGLFIVKNILDLLGGKIKIFSAPERGTRVEILIPS
ncbi:MAG: HAMP domain-containing histidine kinase [Cytophagales bacterium]|nr:HAMP domain-containing histidine kinase [Cytophagales bacterium]